LTWRAMDKQAALDLPFYYSIRLHMTPFCIDNLPFYWRLATKEQRRQNVTQDFFPFEFDVDRDHDLLIQKRNPAVLDALNVVYQQEYNIGYLQDGNHIAKPYGTDFINYLKHHLREHQQIKSILEIGCGGCVVLHELRALGYDVCGIDSSPFAKTEGQKKGIEVIQDFFPSAGLTKKFDLIFHVDVLEHVDDYVSFLKSQHAQLAANGVLVVNVPDVTESIETGDFSMAMHQHLNYFSETSLRSVLSCAGFDVLAINRAGYGGSLYAVGVKRAGGAAVPGAVTQDSRRFLARIEAVNQRFSDLVREILADGNRSLGFYVPLRTLPYIAKNEIWRNIRLFDDTSHWHECYFDGVDIAIENFEDLKRRPVTDMLVMSTTFGDVIKRKIATEFGDAIRVVTLGEIIDWSHEK
jgi:2-polyprenyl-3-methyl-5-hydroxy-6-metoxy-1,4-benzoquinol methylase